MTVWAMVKKMFLQVTYQSGLWGKGEEQVLLSSMERGKYMHTLGLDETKGHWAKKKSIACSLVKCLKKRLQGKNQ